MLRIFLPLLLAAGTPALAQDGPVTPAGREALDVLMGSIPFRTVVGGNEVPKLAAYLSDRLIQAGFERSDINFVPFRNMGYFTVRYHGRLKAKPLVLLAHLDVVEAKREDWRRDPFVPVVEKGYVYGRGSLDDKSSVAILVATLAKLKRAGWMPARDVVLLCTGDEESAMETTALAVEQLKDAEVVLNADAGFGIRDEDGKPLYLSLQAGEKTYADYTLTATDPGGHSSAPRASNAIARMGRAVERVQAFRFPVRQSELTKAYFAAASKTTAGPLGAAMAAFARDANDQAAIATLTDDPLTVGEVRTTCVPTKIEGGHAYNALPQKVTANINCRIFPGDEPTAIVAALTEAIDDPGIALTPRLAMKPAPVSPLRSDVVAAVTKAVHLNAPGVPVIPSMEAGATDSALFRQRGIPAFGVMGVFLKPSEFHAHGLDEVLPVAALTTASGIGSRSSATLRANRLSGGIASHGPSRGETGASRSGRPSAISAVLAYSDTAPVPFCSKGFRLKSCLTSARLVRRWGRGKIQWHRRPTSRADGANPPTA